MDLAIAAAGVWGSSLLRGRLGWIGAVDATTQDDVFAISNPELQPGCSVAHTTALKNGQLSAGLGPPRDRVGDGRPQTEPVARRRSGVWGLVWSAIAHALNARSARVVRNEIRNSANPSTSGHTTGCRSLQKRHEWWQTVFGRLIRVSFLSFALQNFESRNCAFACSNCK